MINFVKKVCLLDNSSQKIVCFFEIRFLYLPLSIIIIIFVLKTIQPFS